MKARKLLWMCGTTIFAAVLVWAAPVISVADGLIGARKGNATVDLLRDSDLARIIGGIGAATCPTVCTGADKNCDDTQVCASSAGTCGGERKRFHNVVTCQGLGEIDCTVGDDVVCTQTWDCGENLLAGLGCFDEQIGCEESSSTCNECVPTGSPMTTYEYPASCP